MSRLRAAAGVAAAQLRHHRARTLLAVVGVAVAVLATALLASLGVGVVETGQQKFDAAGRDLWVTGGSLSEGAGGAGGVGASMLDAHEVAASVEERPAVRSAVPMAFQGVYVANASGEPRTLVGVGVPGAGSSVRLEAGRGFERGDVHYAGGSYDGPMTRAAIVDSRTAELLDVGVGDEIRVGGSVEAARNSSFEVVGISPTFSSFLGAPTVTLHLSELQEIAGTTGTDRATFLAVSLRDDADAEAVAADLRERYPEYTVRTNRDQMRSVLQRNAVVLAVGAALVVLAVVAGFALTLDVLAVVVFQQREELAALTALGVSPATLVGVVAAQGVLVGIAGAAVGVAATPPFAAGLNYAAARIVGFEGLVRTPPWVLAGGAAVALVVGTLAAAVAGWRTVRTVGVEQLR